MRQVDRKARALSPSSPTEREIERERYEKWAKKSHKSKRCRSSICDLQMRYSKDNFNDISHVEDWSELNWNCIEFEMYYIGISLRYVLSC